MSPEMEFPEAPVQPEDAPVPVVEEFRIEEGNPEGFPTAPWTDPEASVTLG